MKDKFQLEFVFGKISSSIMWQHISTSHGLAEWYADDVKVSGDEYTFIWNDVPQTAVLKMSRMGVYVRFHWLDEDPKTFFELRLSTNELTGDVVLTVTDFASEDDMDELIQLWELSVDNLKKISGI